MADFYLERMLKTGRIRYEIAKFVKENNLTFKDPQDGKPLEVLDEKGLIAKLEFDLIPKVRFERADYPIKEKNKFSEMGFYLVN